MKKPQFYNDKSKLGNTKRLKPQQPPRIYRQAERIEPKVNHDSRLVTLQAKFQQQHRITNTTAQLLMTFGCGDHRKIAELIQKWLQQDTHKK